MQAQGASNKLTEARAGLGTESPPERDNQWLLSRSLPIDVRLLVAALATGGGAFTYFWYEKVSFGCLFCSMR